MALYFDDAGDVLDELDWLVEYERGAYRVHRYGGRFVIVPDDYPAFRKRPPVAARRYTGGKKAVDPRDAAPGV